MPETARRYGLEVSRRIDEREDWERSTVAAAEYLRDLLCIFGSNSYLFAIAAYNAGEHKIVLALKHIENPFTERSFWNIREYLPEETQEFVPKVIAAIIIAENPSLFCFTPPEIVMIDEKAVSSKINSVAEEEISSKTSQQDGDSSSFKEAEIISREKSKALQKKGKKAENSSQQVIIYTVKKGNTLYDISRVFNIPYRKIMAWNGLKRGRIFPNMKLKIILPEGIRYEKGVYVVRKGDSLGKIARKLRIPIFQLAIPNGLSEGDLIRVGQKLIYYKRIK
jgi:membrane-bound lytic murein transglycosylase D